MSSESKVLLLNPPGKMPYIRDYYCSKTSKTGSLFPPIDLLMAGGVFRRRGWKVSALDSIALDISPDETLERIRLLKPEAIFCLAGAVSFTEDISFLKAVRKLFPKTTLVGSGDILSEKGGEIVREGGLDAVTVDFSSESAALFAEGAREGLENIYFLRGNDLETPVKPGNRLVSTGIPPHELFLAFPYRIPFARLKPFSSILTDFGCPYNCRFCVMAGLPYHFRPMEEIEEELNYLGFLGIREFFLLDETFGAHKDRAIAFMDILMKGNRRFSWTCFSRPDKIDSEMAANLAKSGCHTVILGVETANENSLKRMNKGFTIAQVREAFKSCRDFGVETVATAIVGLPGETKADVERTYNLLAEISPDYLSLHVAIPRAGTGLRSDLIESGLIDRNQEVMDQSGIENVLPSDALSAAEISALQRRLNLRFYLRPEYLFRTFRRLLHSPGMLVPHFLEGINFLGRYLKKLV